MIFGQTYRNRRAAEQARLMSLVGKRVRWFAWRPVTVNDGRIVWLRYVWRDSNVYYFNFHMRYDESSIGPTYYLTEHGD